MKVKKIGDAPGQTADDMMELRGGNKTVITHNSCWCMKSEDNPRRFAQSFDFLFDNGLQIAFTWYELSFPEK